KTAGHPEFGHAAGIETTTGPLGQGIANAVGFAMAERALNAEFGDDLVNHTTYVIAGDGCLMEGISHEAASLAGHLKLNKLVVLWDDNQITIDGATSLSTSDDQLARFKAYGWATDAVDGHDFAAIRAAIAKAQKSDKPVLISCRTVIAKGAPTKAGKNSSHGSPLGAEEIAGTRAALNWPYAPFEIPSDIQAAWKAAARSRAAAYGEWSTRFEASPKQEAFSMRIGGDLGNAWVHALNKLKQNIATAQPKEATRVSSQNTIDALAASLPAFLGGSADLTGSNNTKAKAMQAFAAPDYAGRYVYYGIREHGMAAAMNGIALHGGFIPYGGTFLVFTDYCRPSMRLSALMQQRVIYVMTHDSIGVGEDGPTHQPVEHLASLRAIPNLNVFRPADAMETAECWQLAIASTETPSVLALTRQALPSLRADYTPENLCARGAYVLREASAAPKVVLFATGSEVSLAVDAREKLEAKGIPTRVVSVPCMDLFWQQPETYRNELLVKNHSPNHAVVRIAIEAAIEQGWEKILGDNGIFIGMTGFGASAPAPELYQHFGITVEAIVAAASA
ncbi:MAG: transketolase, partial [Rhodospirillales bacterium 12-54-5]